MRSRHSATTTHTLIPWKAIRHTARYSTFILNRDNFFGLEQRRPGAGLPLSILVSFEREIFRPSFEGPPAPWTAKHVDGHRRRFGTNWNRGDFLQHASPVLRKHIVSHPEAVPD